MPQSRATHQHSAWQSAFSYTLLELHCETLGQTAAVCCPAGLGLYEDPEGACGVTPRLVH